MPSSLGLGALALLAGLATAIYAVVKRRRDGHADGDDGQADKPASWL